MAIRIEFQPDSTPLYLSMVLGLSPKRFRQDVLGLYFYIAY
jgi:hypothetical protein